MTSDVVDAIKARWAAEGVAIRPGNSPEALAAFEAKYQVALPRAFRDLYAKVDGTGDDSDGTVIRFWPLAEVQPVWEYHRRDPAEAPGFEGRFLFADFMINSHCFIVRLMPDPSDGGPVVSYDGDPIPSARSFAVFLKRYLADRENLGLHRQPPDPRWVARDDGIGLG